MIFYFQEILDPLQHLSLQLQTVEVTLSDVSVWMSGALKTLESFKAR